MKTMLRTLVAILLLSLLLPSTMGSGFAQAQNAESQDTTRARLINAARQVMDAARYCDLITLDETGRPRSRVMDPFAPEDDMVIWLGTNRSSRKVEQIRNDPRVTLQYFDPDGVGYVTIAGTAELVADPHEKELRWKDGWETFYPDRDTYLLIKVSPEWLEVFSIKHGITGDPETWVPPLVDF